jgi:hypothetical protein
MSVASEFMTISLQDVSMPVGQRLLDGELR